MRKLILIVTILLGAIQMHAQGCLANVYLNTFETTPTVLHQASVSVITSSGYGVSQGYDSTLRSGELVELKDGSHIKSGAVFLAKIGACTKSKANNDETLNDSSITVYPNPVTSLLTLSSSNQYIAKVTVTTLDGRIIASHDLKNETSFQLDFSNYPSGIYILAANAADGNIIQEKIVKE